MSQTIFARPCSSISATIWLLAWLAASGVLSTIGSANGADPAVVKIDDLAWLAGTWVQTTDDIHTEEHWLSPKGGMMLGVSRTVRGNRASFEFLRIASTKNGLVYFASPQGLAATEFKLASHAGKRVVFANPEHDFPQEIAYWLDEQGDMRARVSGSLRGQQRVQDFHWQRAR